MTPCFQSNKKVTKITEHIISQQHLIAQEHCNQATLCHSLLVVRSWIFFITFSRTCDWGEVNWLRKEDGSGMGWWPGLTRGLAASPIQGEMQNPDSVLWSELQLILYDLSWWLWQGRWPVCDRCGGENQTARFEIQGYIKMMKHKFSAMI